MKRLAQIVNEAMAESKAQPCPDPRGISKPRTPLGEPMSSKDASKQASDPLAWHLQYWHELGVVGALHSRDMKHMMHTISTEQTKIFDADAEMRFRAAWLQHISIEYARNIALAISIEQSKIRDRDLRAKLRDASFQYECDYRLPTVEHWAQLPEHSEAVQRYLRDLDRLPPDNAWRHFGNRIKAMETTAAFAVKQMEYLRQVDHCWDDCGQFWSV